MKVLLIQPPHYFDGKSRRPGFFPIGFGYFVASLRKQGHEVEVYDIWANQYTEEEVKRNIQHLKYDVVGITALSTQYNYVKWLVGLLKKYNDQPVVLGGPMATFSAEALLKHTLADICVISEGDISFPNIIGNINELNKVNSIVYRENGRIVYTPAQEYVKDLDSLGFPTRDRKFFATDIYLNEACLDGHPNIKAINVTTNRGCPYNCNYCSKTYRKVRTRSVKHVREEIEKLKEEFGIGAVFFNDELLVLNKRRIYELCEELKPLNIIWQGQARVNTVDLDVLKCMKDAGCILVGLGIEHGSQKMLDAMNKAATVEQNLLAIEAAKKAGVEVVLQSIYGFPGEDDNTIVENIDFFRKADSLHNGFFIFTPLPGTEIYNRLIKQKIIVDEDRYLSNLDAGYNTDRKALVNLTEFGLDEFYTKKHQMENRIQWNFFSRHPFKMVIVRDKDNNLKTIPLAWQVAKSICQGIKN